MAGSHFLAMRYIHDCKVRGAPPTNALRRLGERLALDIDDLMALPEKEIRIRMRQSRKQLWECQKTCETLRMEWLETEARLRAQAAGDQEWEKRLRQMETTVKRSAVN
jgi:hypothetical protein